MVRVGINALARSRNDDHLIAMNGINEEESEMRQWSIEKSRLFETATTIEEG